MFEKMRKLREKTGIIEKFTKIEYKLCSFVYFLLCL